MSKLHYPWGASWEGRDNEALPFSVSEQFGRQYVSFTDYYGFMGEARTAPIHLQKISDGKGINFVYSYRKALDKNIYATGIDQISSAMQKMKSMSNNVTITPETFAVALENQFITRQITPLDIENDVFPELTKTLSYRMSERITGAFTKDTYPFTVINAQPPQGRTYYIGAGAEARFGNRAAGNTYNQEFAVGNRVGANAAGMLGIDYLENMLRDIKAYRGLDEIEPFMQESQRYGLVKPMYGVAIGTTMAKQLINDPKFGQEWTTAYHRDKNKSPAGIGNYFGEVRGGIVIEIPELDQMLLDAGMTATYRLGFVFGTNALELGYASSQAGPSGVEMWIETLPLTHKTRVFQACSFYEVAMKRFLSKEGLNLPVPQGVCHFVTNAVTAR